MKSEITKVLISCAGWSLLLLMCFSGCGSINHQQNLTEAYSILKQNQFIDLTHSFEPGIPHWPGFPDEERETLYWYEKGVGTLGHGFFAEKYSFVGQWGTHIDSPAHFFQGLRTLDQIPPEEMLLPLVVIDVHESVARDPDYVVSMDDVASWELEHGTIPQHTFVALRTDWSKRWPDTNRMQNKDAKGVFHYPGWSKEVLKYLFEEREITAVGHETTDTDPGKATSIGDYSLEKYVLGLDRYQIELLANLDQVPEAGGIVIVSFPKPKGGSGFPVRVIAIKPSCSRF